MRDRRVLHPNVPTSQVPNSHTDYQLNAPIRTPPRRGLVARHRIGFAFSDCGDAVIRQPEAHEVVAHDLCAFLGDRHVLVRVANAIRKAFDVDTDVLIGLQLIRDLLQYLLRARLERGLAGVE